MARAFRLLPLPVAGGAHRWISYFSSEEADHRFFLAF